VQNRSAALTEHLTITWDRRIGIDRLLLVGDLDASSVLLLEAELNTAVRPGGALILDLRGLSSIDRWGVHALERAVQRSDTADTQLFLVSEGSALEGLEVAQIGHHLSGSDLSDLLDAGDGSWAPVSFTFPSAQRGQRQLRAAEETP
jgi:anti-anti-sigma regulatory factor